MRKAVKVGLMAFLKGMAQNTHNKTRQYDQYNEPGGFNYYADLEKAATALTVAGKPLDIASELIGVGSKQKNNLDGLMALHTWLQGRKAEHCFGAPTAVYPSPSGLLVIALKPQFGMVEKGGRKLVAIWNTTTPKLTRTVAGVGAYMMKQKLAVGAFADCTCHILDLREHALYTHIPNDAAKLLDIEFAIAEDIIKRYDAA